MRFPLLRPIRSFVENLTGTRRLAEQLDLLRLLVGRAEARHVRSRSLDDLRAAELRVFSQFGEDGILQALIGRVAIERELFVEIGVEDYTEANTRFLLENDHWSGVIVDAGDAHVRFVRQRGLDWRYGLLAVQAFVTRENVDELLRDAGVGGDIGLLSIDIDGNDYWILEAVGAIEPRIIVVEYNAVFGPEAAITVPYAPRFERMRAHWSGLYFGASLAALEHLASAKGYRLVGTNRAGNNAFFVRSDVLGELRAVAAREAWARCRFRQARDEAGRLTLADPHTEGLKAMARLPVVEVSTGRTTTVGEALAGP